MTANDQEELPKDALQSQLVELREQLRRQELLIGIGQALSLTLDFQQTLSTVVRLAVPALADLCFIDVAEEGQAVRRREAAFADPAQQDRLREQLVQLALLSSAQSPQTAVMTSGKPAIFDVARLDVEALQSLGAKSMMVVPVRARDRTLGALTFVAAESARNYSTSDLQFAQQFADCAATALDNAQLYRQANLAIRSRENLLAVVSHDLRSPLAVIQMKAAMLLKSTRGSERRARSVAAVDSIHTSAKQMSRLISDLLDAARIDAGNLSIERAQQPASRLISDAMELVMDGATQRAQTLSCDVASDFPVYCDRERILQVLVNLLDNAIKFAPEGSAISLKIEANEHENLFTVRDHGPGIRQDQLPFVFNRFWQAKEVSRLGAGLGLSISKGIVEAHGGRIWVESLHGQGSTFFFTLPKAPSKAGSDQRRVVLIVDDDPEACAAFGLALKRHGYEVATAGNGQEALDYLRRSPPPFLILLDMAMPIMDGWGFLAERSRDPALNAIPVIVVSAMKDIEEKVVTANAGFLCKPFASELLLERVEHARPRGAGPDLDRH